MKFQKIVELVTFLIGIVIGFTSFYCICVLRISNKYPSKITNIISKHNSTFVEFNHKLYNTSTANKLYNRLKILCLVLTYPNNHQTDAVHVKNTWGSKCNKLIFLSTENDTELGAVALPVEEGYQFLWGKVKLGFEMAYAKYFDEYDWFVKGDDDS